MKPTDLKRVFEVFREVAGLDATTRQSALDRACAGDLLLRKKVERMLDEDSRSEVPLDHPIGIPLPALADGAEREFAAPHPERIGAYSVQGVIDVGGMGTVYAATQDQPSRRVALKTIRAGFAGQAMLKRFRLEAEVLGSLKHPGIAQVYESGVVREGTQQVPFIAMELVAGARSLLGYAREKQLGRRERIRLFLAACDAVHYGHQRGVIHRDLKPKNLLVDENGALKVIDFGLARVLDSEAYTLSMAETGSGQMIGTLQYMSPEQLAETTPAPDIRIDVYSLGVVLFELLADRFPYDVEGLALPGVVRVISSSEPHRLGQLRPDLSGDLEWIVGQAMERDAERRYSSVSELAADLRRYLKSEPVSVGPPSGWYRFSKFTRRHRSQVGAAALLAVVLVGGVASTLWQSARARSRLEERNLQLEISEAASGFMQRVFRSVRPEVARGAEVSAREVLDEARRELIHAPPEHARVEAEVRRNLGETYSAIGELEIAAEQLERSLELQRAEYGPSDARTLDTELSWLLDRLDLGAIRDVEQRAGELLEALCADAEADPALVVRAGIVHGAALGACARFDAADRVLKLAVERAEDALGDDHDLTWASRQQRVVVLGEAGRFSEASELKRRIADHRADRRGALDPVALSDGVELAQILAMEGDVEQAEELWDELLPELEQVLGPEHPRCLTQRALRGWTLLRAGQFAQGAPHLDMALSSLRALQGKETPGHLSGMLTCGDGLTQLGRFDEAVELYGAGLEARERLSLPPTLESCELMLGLGNALMRLGELQQAEAVYIEAEREATELLGEHWFTFQIRQNLGGLYYAQGRYREARGLIESGIPFFLETAGPDDPLITLLARSNYSTLLREMGELELAREVMTDVLERRERILPQDHADIWLSRLELAVLAGRSGQHDQAMRGLRELMAKLEPGDPLTVQARYHLAAFLREVGKFEEADELLRQISGSAGRGPAVMNVGPRFERAELELARGNLERAEGELIELARIVADLPPQDFTHSMLESLNGRMELRRNLSSPEGIELLERARAGFLEKQGERSWRAIDTGRHLLAAYQAAGRLDEAEELRAQLVALEPNER